MTETQTSDSFGKWLLRYRRRLKGWRSFISLMLLALTVFVWFRFVAARGHNSFKLNATTIFFFILIAYVVFFYYVRDYLLFKIEANGIVDLTRYTSLQRISEEYRKQYGADKLYFMSRLLLPVFFLLGAIWLLVAFASNQFPSPP